MRRHRDCLPWAARSSSSPPTSSATTRSAATAARIARTPVVDRLAADGITFRRAYNQNTVCMPARSTMLTGQYVRTHGVVANGIALPEDAPSVAAYLHEQAGLPHRADRQGPLRARLRPEGPVGGERPLDAGRHRSVARLRVLDPGRAHRRVQRAARSSTTAAGSRPPPRAPARASRRCSARTPGGDTMRAGDQAQPDPARVVPHRLGGRPHHRLARLARTPTTTGSAG